MSNRFPEEPYPVITDWPGTEGHNEGEFRCYHYTLTQVQVAQNRDAALAAASGTDIEGTAFLDGLGLGLLKASLGLNAINCIMNAFVQKSGISAQKCQANLFKTWRDIYRHMVDGHYPRVTISQQLKLIRKVEGDPAEHPFEQPWPVKSWVPIGLPRVPLEKYYLDH